MTTQIAILMQRMILLQLVTLTHRMMILVLGTMAPANDDGSHKQQFSCEEWLKILVIGMMAPTNDDSHTKFMRLECFSCKQQFSCIEWLERCQIHSNIGRIGISRAKKDGLKFIPTEASCVHRRVEPHSILNRPYLSERYGSIFEISFSFSTQAQWRMLISGVIYLNI